MFGNILSDAKLLVIARYSSDSGLQESPLYNIEFGGGQVKFKFTLDAGQPFELNPRVVLLMRGGGYEYVGCLR